MATAESGKELCVLINVFEVPESQAEELFAHFTATKNFLEKQDEYISTKLHRSLDSKPKFPFINVAEWKSSLHFQSVISSDEFRHHAATFPGTSTASLYWVVSELAHLWLLLANCTATSCFLSSWCGNNRNKSLDHYSELYAQRSLGCHHSCTECSV